MEAGKNCIRCERIKVLSIFAASRIRKGFSFHTRLSERIKEEKKNRKQVNSEVQCIVGAKYAKKRMEIFELRSNSD